MAVEQACRPAPASYQFPALSWIRGLDLEGRLDQGQVVLHAEVEMPLAINSPGEADEAKPSAAAAQPAPARSGLLPKLGLPQPALAKPVPPRPAPGPPAPGRPAGAKEF